MTQKLIKKYIELLLKWNAKLNLTAITKPAEIEVKHVEDSLALLPYLDDASSLLDLGAGAGFPGIPLAVYKPELRIVLLEATRKKISFMQAAIRELSLSNANAVCGRAENEELQERLGKFDCVTSRATWELKDFLPIASAYCSARGRVIAMKSSKWQEELSAAAVAIDSLDLELCATHEYKLSNSDPRALLVFKHI